MCPYYAKNEDYCDVGCGYITSCDVNTIIRYCMRSHAKCMKYRELADRGVETYAYASINGHSVPS